MRRCEHSPIGRRRVIVGVVRRKKDPLEPDPVEARFDAIAKELSTGALGGDGDAEADAREWGLTQADLDGAMGLRPATHDRLLGFYTVAGLRYGLGRYGILPRLEGLGYGDLRIELDQDTAGERLRLHGTAEGREHLLVECVIERRVLAGHDVLFVHWLTLRNPRASFTPDRVALPGQEVPGLGLGREADEMLLRMAKRIGLAGVSFRPSQLHVAVVAHPRHRFVDAARQGRFEALVRDLATHPLSVSTAAVDAGRVRFWRAGGPDQGTPYVWEPDEMIHWVEPPADDAAEVAAERASIRFAIA